jgi:hypothetical protein
MGSNSAPFKIRHKTINMRFHFPRPIPCPCGSGETSRELYDGHGIYLTRACDKCEKEALSGFRSDILEAYETEETIDEN